MNTQDILQKGGTKLGISIDMSETFDFELFTDILIDVSIDTSETYDFELVKEPPNKIVEEYYVEIKTYRILTEDGGVLKTEDNFRIRY